MTAATRRSEALFTKWERPLLGVLSVVGFVFLWEATARTGLIDARVIGSPLGIANAAIAEIPTPRFLTDLQTSVFEFGVGYGLAVVAGVVLGLVLGWYRRTSYLFEPMLNFMYALPTLALMPLIVLAFGLTVWSTVLIVFLSAFLAIIYNTFAGVRTVDARWVAVARTFGASEGRKFRSVILPATIPFILAGLRLGIERGLYGVVVGELFTGGAGLGFSIRLASNNLQVDRVLFMVMVFITLGVMAIESIRRVEARFSGWRSGTVISG